MGLVMGGLIIPWLLVRLGWRPTFQLIGFGRPVVGDPLALGYKRAARPAIPPSRVHPQPEKQELRWLLTNRNLIGICLGFFCFDYYWYLFVTWLPDYLVTVRHFTILRAGFFSSLPYFVFGASEPLGGWIADRLTAFGWNETRTRKGIVTIAFLSGLLLIPASRVQNATAAVALIAGASLVGLATGNLLVILQCCAPPGRCGFVDRFRKLRRQPGRGCGPTAYRLADQPDRLLCPWLCPGRSRTVRRHILLLVYRRRLAHGSDGVAALGVAAARCSGIGGCKPSPLC